jgi:hypothetical protein
MGRDPTLAYVATTVVAAAMVVVGVWLPWVRKRPVGYFEGRPYYTGEWTTGLESGFGGTDVVAVLVVVAVVAITVLSRTSNWRPDVALVVAGGLLAWAAGTVLRDYWTTERYAVEPGLYVLVAGSLLLLVLGVGSVLGRRLPPLGSHDGGRRTG